MTLTYLGLQRTLPRSRQSPAPPAILTNQLWDRLRPRGVPRLSPSAQQHLALASHIAYSVGCCIGLASIAPRIPLSPVIKGAAFGTGVWALSYLGWIPVAQLRPAAPRAPASRNFNIFFAHMVWGIAASLFEDSFRNYGKRDWEGARKALRAE